MTAIEKQFYETSKAAMLYGITAEKVSDFRSFKKINDISRQYLMLMMKMQESSLLLSMFSEVDFNKGEIIVNSTVLAEHFLTEGVVIYSIVSIDGEYNFDVENDYIIGSDGDKILKNPLQDRGIFGIPVKETAKYRNEVLNYMHVEFGIPINEADIKTDHEYKSKNGVFKIHVIARESGCGFHIPDSSTIRLDPRLIWTQTKLKLNHRIESKDGCQISEANDGIYIINTAGGVEWFQSDWKSINEMDNAAFMQQSVRKVIPEVLQTESFQELGSNKTKMNVLDNESGAVDRAIIVMPFICCAFDMLTEVYYNGADEPLILFTT